MPSVTFRGKTYNSEFEMPEDIRRAYQESQARKTTAKSLTDVVDMPQDVKAIYQRAMDRVEENLGRSPAKKIFPEQTIFTDNLHRTT